MDETTKAYYDLINRQQQANNEWSAQQAQKAMDYQTEMSNTAHQREVKDLIAAGLNPVLSAGGTGATTGSGVAASAGNENVSALYGLAKQAIDANMKQAEAMANQAKSVADASSGRGSGSGSSGRGSGSGPKREDVEAYADTVKSVWNSLFDGKNNALAEFLDLSDLSKDKKMAICAGLHMLIPGLTTSQIYNVMEALDLWDLPNQATGHVGPIIGNIIGDIVSGDSNSGKKAETSWISEVGEKVADIIHDNVPKNASSGVIGAVHPKKSSWIDKHLSKPKSYSSSSKRGNSNPKYRPSQTKN